MDNSVREILYNALQELLEDQFKEFKWRLRNLDHKRKIPAAQLEKADKMDIVDLLCSFYGEDNAGNVCIGVLEALHLKGAAGNLREDIWNDHRPKEAREHEIMTSGWQHAQIMRNRDSQSITIPTLFKPDKCGLVPDTVVLQGAAGIGKTMTARKIMLDWACGELYQGMFDYIFYIHCREMNLNKKQSSIADLLFKQLPSEDAIRELLKNPQKLLFVIDGFDELRFCIDQPEDHLCNNPWKKQSVTIVLSSLFRRKMLPESRLLITTRPTALEKLSLLLGRSRYAEILGFSPEDRREYFHKFFPNKDQAEKAFRVAQQNETLFTMCFVPIVCWIICTVLKEELNGSEDLVQSSNTITAVYMRYLLTLLKPLKSQGKGLLRTNLRGLCSLAMDGIWKRQILFGEEVMQKYGLDQEDSLPLFLNENIFKRDIECICAYSFIHLSFQEFFAALSYVLEEEEDAMSLEKRIQHVRTLLESYRTSRHDLVLTIRFLFGLLNEEKRMKGLKKRLGWKMSQSVKELLLQWVKDTTKAKIVCGFSYKPELFGFLFEIQDEYFLNSSLNHVTEVKLSRIVLTEMEEVILAFCLKNCHHLEVLDAFCCSPVQDIFEKDARKVNQEDNEREELLSSSQIQSNQ
ncbi:NACHT, LRR and PYD domains-containing protein 12-like [Tiliqua scincoides]|uniref:NACHT, LRR and PYD domains-containing protein 12-like n=1 Tax=Tiliqua scincoides TaxID=71010 RepID=UPI0034618F9D